MHLRRCPPDALPALLGKNEQMTKWEYLIVALPPFELPTTMPGASAAVQALNEEGALGWEAVGMSVLADGNVAVLLKKPLVEDVDGAHPA
jgi:hypothetical protein